MRHPAEPNQKEHFMKCQKVSTSNSSGGDKTPEEFAGSEEARSPSGQVVLALAAETAWSAGYAFNAKVRDNDFSLLIEHALFGPPPNNWMVFKPKAGEEVSVRAVEDAVRAYHREIAEKLQFGATRLQQDANKLFDEANEIVTRKARAA